MKGQTLIEVVIAIGLVSFILVGLVAGATLSVSASRLAHERNVANQLAALQLEQVRQARDRDPAGFFGDTASIASSSGVSPKYTIAVTKTLNGEQMEVNVAVSWQNANVTFHTNQSTLLTKWQ